MELIPFASQARRHFDRVAERYGLSCSAASDRFVRYENRKVFLVVNFDNGRSFELGIEIGRPIPGQVERPFSLAEILRLRSAPEAAMVEGLSISALERLDKHLGSLSELTTRYADEFLKGSDRSFAEIGELRENESIAYAIQRDLRSAQARAKLAWDSKNYAGVVATLEPMRHHLSPADIKRLEYSLKRLGS